MEQSTLHKTVTIRPRRERTRERLAPEEAQKLLDTSRAGGTEQGRDYCLLLLMYRHGLRVSEACQLKVSDILQKWAASSAFVESTINQLVSKRFVRKQQMSGRRRGAHLLLQRRTKVLNDDLGTSSAVGIRSFKPERLDPRLLDALPILFVVDSDRLVWDRHGRWACLTATTRARDRRRKIIRA